MRAPLAVALAFLLGLASGAVGDALKQQLPIPLPAAMGGSGVTSIGTMASQNANAVAVTGGTVNGATIGATTAAAAKVTTLGVSNVVADTSYSYQTPSTGFSITPGAGVGRLILDPAATLVSGTVTMPAAPVVDGQILVLISSQIITTLTLAANAGQSILGAPTTLALGGRIECIYRTANTTWYC